MRHIRLRARDRPFFNEKRVPQKQHPRVTVGLTTAPVTRKL